MAARGRQTTMRTFDFEAGLNPEQVEVVRHESGPCRVDALAGCHRRGQPILMHDGSQKRVEDVVVGDLLMGPGSAPRNVLRLCRGRGRMVEVRPIKGEAFVVNEDHVLTLVESVSGRVRDVRVGDVGELALRKQWKLFREGVEFGGPARQLVVDPYFLGVFLGDGRASGSISVSKPDEEIIAEVRAQAIRWGLVVKKDGVGTSASYLMTTGPSYKGQTKRGRNPLLNAIRDMGLFDCNAGTKFIPVEYKTASRQARLQILAGLLDTDGHLSTNCYDYISKSPDLARDVAFVARSLGLAAYVTECEKQAQTGARGTYYRVSISGELGVVPCRIPRKIAGPRLQKKNVLRTGFSLHYLDYEDYFGFELDGDHRYLLGDFTVTHNSGKTECVTRRVARMVSDGKDPKRILAVTFSTKGAEEMNKRISKKFGVYGARVGTWHSLCMQILREDGHEAAAWQVEGDGKGTNPKMVLKDVLGFKHMNWVGADLASVSGFIGRCKANLYAPESEEAARLASRLGNPTKLLEAFSRYNDELRAKGLLTFDDMLVFAAEHLMSDENVRLAWAGRWSDVLQDEAQDANRAQKTIAELLARDHRNYMVIGDCFQAIFGFRGSSPEFLAKFSEDWPDARTIVLPRNYRSGRKILDAANKVVSKARIDGIDSPTMMIGERDVDGEVRVLCAESLDDEGNTIASRVQSSVEAGDSDFDDHTVLFRTNAQSRALEEAMLKRKIPYVVIGGVSFYERKEVRDLLAYLRLAARRGTKDDIKRSINTPFRFLGNAFVERLMDHVGRDTDDVDWPSAVLEVADQVAAQVKARQKQSAGEWATMIRGMREVIDRGMLDDAGQDAKDNAKPARLLDDVVRATQYITWLNKEEGGETTENSGAANVREMVRVAERFDTAEALLDYIDETIRSARKQRDDKQAGGQRVVLCSVHRSKGLEWPYVYVAGMNEMVLPHAKGDLEEERRLAYVAMTRARDVLTLSYVMRIATRVGIRNVEPSPFLLDTGLPLDGPGGDGEFVSAAMDPIDPFETLDV